MVVHFYFLLPIFCSWLIHCLVFKPTHFTWKIGRGYEHASSYLGLANHRDLPNATQPDPIRFYIYILVLHKQRRATNYLLLILLMPFYYHHRYKCQKHKVQNHRTFYLKQPVLICSTGFVTCEWKRKKLFPPSMAFQSIKSQTVTYGKYHTKTLWLNPQNNIFFKLEK